MWGLDPAKPEHRLAFVGRVAWNLRDTPTDLIRAEVGLPQATREQAIRLLAKRMMKLQSN